MTAPAPRQRPEDALAFLLEAIQDADIRRILGSSEAFSLFSRLDNELHLARGGQAQCLLVASAQAKEGRSTLSMLLACLTAAYDPSRRVLLADCDVRSDALAKRFGCAPGTLGLHEWMCRQADLSACQRPGPLSNLTLLPGCGVPSPRNKFHHQRFSDWVVEARSTHDLIIVDSPAARDNGDVISAGKAIGDALIVVKFRGPNRQQVQSLIAELRRAGTEILGTVLNERMFPVPRLFYGR